MRKMIVAVVSILFSLTFTPLMSIDFSLPIDCALGENCHIQNYVDIDGKGTDYTNQD